MGTELGTRYCTYHGVKESLREIDWAGCEHCGHVWQSRTAWETDTRKTLTRNGRQCPLCKAYAVHRIGKGVDGVEIEERQRKWHKEMLIAHDYVILAENSISRAIDAIPPKSAANGPMVDTSEVDSLQAEASVYAAMATMHYAAASALGNFPA